MENGKTLTSRELHSHRAAASGSELRLLRSWRCGVVATVSSAPCWLSRLAHLYIVPISQRISLACDMGIVFFTPRCYQV